MSARFLLAALGLLLLAGCASKAPLRSTSDDQATVQALQKQRAAHLQDMRHWRLLGRVAVRDGKDGGSGSLDWLQDGAFFTVSLRAPVTAQTWRLSGDADLVSLEGVGDAPMGGNDAEQLLRDAVGWEFPVDFLRDWTRGLASENKPWRGELNAQGQLQFLWQGGWQIEFQGYQDVTTTALPLRIKARKDHHELRLIVQSWELNRGG